jgi:uncharacterized protein
MRCTVADEKIRVEVAYATPEEQALLTLEAEGGLSIRQAIERCGILRQFPEIDLRENKVGIFGKLASLDQALEDGDRAEIYRPLIADPKEARKRRAAQGKVMRRGAGDTGGEAPSSET